MQSRPPSSSQVREIELTDGIELQDILEARLISFRWTAGVSASDVLKLLSADV